MGERLKMAEAADRRMIGALLRVPYQATVTRVAAALNAAGFDDLRPAHLAVFQQIERGGLRLTELAERAQITKQSMGYLVDYLEARGYVERATDPSDGRAKLIRLTERGREVERVARASLAQLEADWSARLGAERFAALRQTLRDLIATFEP